MEKLTIDNWDEIDQVSFYTYHSTHHPLVYSDEHHIWIANSYTCCKSILSSDYVQVLRPGIPQSGTLNTEALLMLNNLVRINNEHTHRHARLAALLLYDCIKVVNIGEIVDRLLVAINNYTEFDWVAVICKRLPVISILKGLSFPDEDCDWVIRHMPLLTKIMLPVKTKQDVEDINSVMPHFYQMAMQYINEHELVGYFLKSDKALTRTEASTLLICNLLGLLIQSYDACRAMLTITAITLNRLKTERIVIKPDHMFFQKLIDELFRFDPPVHNTKRIATADFEINGQIIKQGEAILVVLGAANMDHMVFNLPEHFDLERGNNNANIIFGLGGHACIAKYFCNDMAIQTCRHITDKFGVLTVLPQNITYESQLNVKMAKKLMVSL